MASEVMRVGEVAEALDIPRGQVYALVRAGSIRKVEGLGRRIRVPRAAIADLLRRGVRGEAALVELDTRPNGLRGAAHA